MPTEPKCFGALTDIELTTSYRARTLFVIGTAVINTQTSITAVLNTHLYPTGNLVYTKI
jgi:hypothetical protein